MKSTKVIVNTQAVLHNVKLIRKLSCAKILAIVKANASVLDLLAHTRHSAHVFSYGKSVRIYFANQLVSQLKISDRFEVGIHAEVHVEAAECGAQTVVVIQHGCDSVEAEPVEVVFLHPESEIAQKEVKDFGLVVVEELGAPRRVVAFRPLVEELILSPVKHIESFESVAYCV